MEDITAHLHEYIAKILILASACVLVRLSVFKDSRIAEWDFMKSGNWGD